MIQTPVENAHLATKHPPHDAVAEVSEALRALLADIFTLYLKTMNFHWHMTGQHFHDYHLLLDDQATQIFAMTDDIAERARKLGGRSLHSIGEIARLQRLRDNDSEAMAPLDMLRELHQDNATLTFFLQSAHALCSKHADVATAVLIEQWIDQAQRRNLVPGRDCERFMNASVQRMSSIETQMIGSSPAFRAVIDQVNAIAPVDSAVLIQGETGTGKELVARLIHEQGRRGSTRKHGITRQSEMCSAVSWRSSSSERQKENDATRKAESLSCDQLMDPAGKPVGDPAFRRGGPLWMVGTSGRTECQLGRLESFRPILRPSEQLSSC